VAHLLKPRVDSLKARMALLMGLVLIAPAAYAVIQAVGAHLQQSERVTATLQRTARLIATYQAETMAQSRRGLERIAALPAVQGGPEIPCREAVAAELQQLGELAELAVSGAQGEIRCAVPADLVGRSVAAEDWFGDLEAGFRFVVSDLVAAKERPAIGTIVLAVPIVDAAQRFAGAVAATVRADAFTAVPSDLELPEAAVAYLVDSRGQPLDANLDTVPGSLRGDAMGELLEEPGRPILTDLDGQERRRFVAESVLGGRLFVVVGLPAPRWSWLQQELIIGVFAPTLMLALAVIAIWTATDFLINRHIRTLAGTAKAYSRGAFEAEPDLAQAPTELKQLGATMAQMARRIRRRERELEASLAQKDVLLKEIHHRIKNNLQIVTSLLNLRARTIASPPAQEAMLEAQVRIRALALVHRSLYEQEDVQLVELGGFLEALGELLSELLAPENQEIELELQADPVQVSPDQAIPLALLITEAVSNAYQHAFPDGRAGTIRVRLANHDGEAALGIVDDGVGLERAAGAEPPRTAATRSVGLTLIDMLTRQIGGRVEIDGRAGTSVTVTFAIPPSSPGKDGQIRADGHADVAP
jgi:two-component sensor histidine kinase